MATLTASRNEKLDTLIRRKERELGVILVDTRTEANGDTHLLMKKYGGSKVHIVWTTFDTGEPETTYSDFYKGLYNQTYESGQAELARRCSKVVG